MWRFIRRVHKIFKPPQFAQLYDNYMYNVQTADYRAIRRG